AGSVISCSASSARSCASSRRSSGTGAGDGCTSAAGTSASAASAASGSTSADATASASPAPGAVVSPCRSSGDASPRGSASDIELVRDLAQHGGGLAAVPVRRIVAAAQVGADTVEQLHEV